MCFMLSMLAFCLTATATQKVVQVDSTGRKEYHKQQYVVEKDKVIPVDSTGRKEYHKPSYVIKTK